MVFSRKPKTTAFSGSLATVVERTLSSQNSAVDNRASFYRTGDTRQHIVFVNRFFYPDESATSQILSDLAFHLADEGHDISVITSRLNYGEHGRDRPSRENIKGVDVHRVWTTQFNRGHLLGRSVDFASFYVSTIARLLAVADKGALVVLKTDPPMLATAVSPVLRLKRARYCNWLQDLFPEVAEAAGFRVASGFFGAMMKKLRNRTLRRAQMNIVIGERMQQRLIDEGVPRQQIMQIPNWSAGDDVVPLPTENNSLRGEWDLADDFVVGYSGNFGRAHEFQTLLSAAKALQPYVHIKLLLIGHGVRREAVEAFVDQHELSNVVFKPFQPRSRLQESLGVADVHIVSLLPEMEGLIVPSKTYGIAAAGRPVIFIGDKDGEIARLVENYEFGSAVSIGDSETLANVIIRMAEEPGFCDQLGRNARVAFDTSYSDTVALGKWRELVDKCFVAAVN